MEKPNSILICALAEEIPVRNCCACGKPVLVHPNSLEYLNERGHKPICNPCACEWIAEGMNVSFSHTNALPGVAMTKEEE